MNVKKELEVKAGTANGIYLNNIEIDPLTIKAIMINEVVPSDPLQDFNRKIKSSNGNRGHCCYVRNNQVTPILKRNLPRSRARRSRHRGCQINLYLRRTHPA